MKKQNLFLCNGDVYNLSFLRCFDYFINNGIEKEKKNLDADLRSFSFIDDKRNFLKNYIRQIQKEIIFKTRNFSERVTIKGHRFPVMENFDATIYVEYFDTQLQNLFVYHYSENYYRTRRPNDFNYFHFDDYKIVSLDTGEVVVKFDIAIKDSISPYGYILEKLDVDAKVYRPLMMYYLSIELTSKYNEMVNYNEPLEIDGNVISISDTKKFLLLNELGVIDKVHEIEQNLDLEPTGRLIAKYLGMNPNYGARLIRRIKSKKDPLNPYNTESNQTFIKNVKELLS